MKPDHLSAVVFEFRIIAKSLVESARVLLAPQKKKRRHQEKRK
jgi:hypothetical protein